MPTFDEAFEIGRRFEPAFADDNALRRNFRRQLFADGQRCLECPQIAIIDADQARTQSQRAIELGFVMNLQQHIHAEIEGRVLDVLGGRVIERRHDDEDAIGAPGARFRDLIDVEHEILAQGGKGGCVARLRQEFRLALE